MRTTEPKSKPAIGFLTVLEDAEHGLFGGYLVLGPTGRPIEFHCTTPVKPNRAQQILYGPTLESFLYGDQIGRTLLANSKTEPVVVCTDCEPMLAVRQFTEVPLALVVVEQVGPEGAPAEPKSMGGRNRPTWRVDPSHRGRIPLAMFEWGRNRLAVPEPAADDRQQFTQRLGQLCEWLDLAEPFQRIREAIEEARRGGA